VSLTLTLALIAVLAPSPPDSAHCAAAARFLRDEQGMIAEVDADIIDDWRTGKRLAGCRVTAAGATTLGVAREAVRFYERMRAAGWTRTPDPRDAPNEASLRFRRERSDCVFNVYEGANLLTEAETRVNEALQPRPGEARYQVLALCMPAMAAKAR
jgi:hypothetical protein